MGVRVFIVDDHPVVVAGLKSLLSQLNNIEVAGAVSNAFEAIPFLKSNPVDVILLDINLPDVSGIDLCKKIHKEFPDIKIVGISTFSDRSYISRMIENGALGYLLKSASPEEITEAIKTVMEGKMYLSVSTERLIHSQHKGTTNNPPAITKREKEVLALIAEGFTNGQIAEKLFISPLTVDSHRKNLLTKFQVSNTAALIRIATEHRLT